MTRSQNIVLLISSCLGEIPEYYSNLCNNHPVICYLSPKKPTKKKTTINHSFSDIALITGNLPAILDTSPQEIIVYNYVNRDLEFMKKIY